MGNKTNRHAWFSVRGEQADFHVRAVDDLTAIDATIGYLAKRHKLGLDPWTSDFRAELLPDEQATLHERVLATAEDVGSKVLLMALDVDQRVPGRDYPYPIDLAI